MSDKGLMKILRRYRSNLRELNLFGSNIREVSIKRGVRSLPQLEILNLAYCNNLIDLSSDRSITGIGLKYGVKSLSNLETLSFDSCINLENGGLVEILSISGRKIRYLYVCRTSITGFGIVEGVESITNLESLIMAGCRELSNENI